MNRTMTRRAAVLAGLGAATLAPAAAVAGTVKKMGYREDGEAYEGLVTVEGKTYLYRGGEMYRGGAVEYKGSRWFSPEDGHMAVGEWVEAQDGTYSHYSAEGVEDASLEVPASGEGWTESSGRMFYMEDGQPHRGWLVTASAPDGVDRGLQRYWLDEACGAMADNESVTTSDGTRARALKGGTIARGAADDGEGHVWIADNDGRLLCMGSGWKTGNDIFGDGSGSWYWMLGDGSAKRGSIQDGGKEYWGKSDGSIVAGGAWLDRACKQVIWGDASGAVNGKMAVDGLGGELSWDFTDWDFTWRMKTLAEQTGSSTDMFCAISVDAPVRCVVLNRRDGVWVPVAGWHCTTGRKYVDGYCGGLPRESGGAHTITNKWEPNTPSTPSGPGYCLDFIEYYPSADWNDSASWHAIDTDDTHGREYWGYTTHSCIGTTWARNKWLYDNIGYGTGMFVDGACGGINDTDGDSLLCGYEWHTSAIEDPFA